MDKRLWRVHVASSAFEARVNGSAPTAYCYYVMGSENAKWGYASERDTQLMTGRAITRAINDIYLEGDPDPQIEIIALKTGFEKYYNEFLPAWIAQDCFTKRHGGHEWKEAALIALVGNAIIRKPADAEETRVAKAVANLARGPVREAGKQAFARDPSLYGKAGTILTDEDPGAPVLPMGIP